MRFWISKFTFGEYEVILGITNASIFTTKSEKKCGLTSKFTNWVEDNSLLPPTPEIGKKVDIFGILSFLSNDLLMKEAWEHWSINALAKKSQPKLFDTFIMAVGNNELVANCQDWVDNAADSVTVS